MAEINLRPPRSPKAFRIKELLVYLRGCLAASERSPILEADLQYNYECAAAMNNMPHLLSHMVGHFGPQMLTPMMVRTMWSGYPRGNYVYDLASIIHAICTEIVSEYALPKDECSVGIFLEATQVRTFAARLKLEASDKDMLAA